MEEEKDGWVSIYRKLLDNEIFKNKPDKWFKIWIYILLSVNHKDNEDKNGFRRGERFFKSEWIQEKCNATSDQVKKCVAFLKTSTMISTIKSTRGFTVKVLNYDRYQFQKENQAPHKAPRKALIKHHESTTINNNDNNDNNDITINNSSSKAVALQNNGNEINKCFDYFYKINPLFKFGNVAQRNAMERIIKKIGIEKTTGMLEYVIHIQGEKFAPQITSPIQLENKMGELIAFARKNKQKTNQVTEIVYDTGDN
jgi:hypothetical protein